MKLKYLKIIVDKLVSNGKGDLPVVFDAEARSFHLHYVAIDEAGDTGLPDAEDNFFVLNTKYHTYPRYIIDCCECQDCMKKLGL